MDPAAYGIKIDPVGLVEPAASTYKRKVREHLTWIHATKMGLNLLRAIKYHGLPVEIEPYTGGDCNATGGWRTVGGSRQGIAHYSPDTFSLHGACPAKKTKPNKGLYWDEILFHELVHVLRGVSSKFAKRVLGGGLYRYKDSEEFFAVMITNIYISDPTNRIKSGLRGEHRGFNGLHPDYAVPWGFFAASREVFPLVKQFVNENHGFSTMVANTEAEFNPIADYYVDADKAAKLSRNATTNDILGLTADLLGV